MFNPQPKPVKTEKNKKVISKTSSKAKYACSDGSNVSQAYIESKLVVMRLELKNQWNSRMCQAYFDKDWNDVDHTISQKRCKELGKTELIWDIDNCVLSSRLAHMQWESYKSGIFKDHANVIKRMKFVKKHDPEGFEKRIQYINDSRIVSKLRED